MQMGLVLFARVGAQLVEAHGLAVDVLVCGQFAAARVEFEEGGARELRVLEQRERFVVGVCEPAVGS